MFSSRLVLNNSSRKLLAAKKLEWTVKRQLHCTSLIVGSLTKSYVNNSLRAQEPGQPIDLDKAHKQHQYQIDKLSRLVNGNIIQVPPHEEYPDIVFVDDPAFIINGKALITQMKPKTRAGEIGPMKQALETNALKLGIKEIVHMDTPGAYLDAGDIMFTGREFLIGLSQRTNALGIEEFARHFSAWPISGIRVPHGILHLKSLSSLCGTTSIAISSSTEGKEVWKEINLIAQYKYDRVIFPDNNGANCLLINGVILHPSQDEYPESFKIWEAFDGQKIPLPNSEFYKADGSLTCNSVRVIQSE